MIKSETSRMRLQIAHLLHWSLYCDRLRVFHLDSSMVESGALRHVSMVFIWWYSDPIENLLTTPSVQLHLSFCVSLVLLPWSTNHI